MQETLFKAAKTSGTCFIWNKKKLRLGCTTQKSGLRMQQQIGYHNPNIQISNPEVPVWMVDGILTKLRNPINHDLWLTGRFSTSRQPSLFLSLDSVSPSRKPATLFMSWLTSAIRRRCSKGNTRHAVDHVRMTAFLDPSHCMTPARNPKQVKYMDLYLILGGFDGFSSRMGWKWVRIDGKGYTNTTYISEFHPYIPKPRFRIHSFFIFRFFICFEPKVMFF